MQSRRLLRAREYFACENAMLKLIFLRHNIKDGGYEHKQAAFARPKYTRNAGYPSPVKIAFV